MTTRSDTDRADPLDRVESGSGPAARSDAAAAPELRALTDAAVDAIVSADAGGRIVAWNPAAERMFGYRTEEILGQSLEILIPEPFREAHRSGLRRVAAGKPGKMLGSTKELQALRVTGETFPIELSLSSWTVGRQRFFTGIIRDVTRRKRIQRELERSAKALEIRNAELMASKRQLQDTVDQLESMYGLLADLLEGHVMAGRYLLERKLRADAVGVLYAAIDLEQRVGVGVRVCRAPRVAADTLAATNMEFSHRHAAEILDRGICEVGLPYLVFEALSGETLTQRLQRGRGLDASIALQWALQVLDALEAAHAHGVVHGRVGPDAVFLRALPDEDAPVVTLLDFGVDALVCGTPLASKQALLGSYWPSDGPCPADEYCDVHGAAVLLCRLLTGFEPEPGDSVGSRAWLQRGVPPALAGVLDAAMAPRSPETSTRPSIADLESAVRALLESTGPAA